MSSPLDLRIEVETPERVVLVHDLAGIGSRFAAGLVDALVMAPVVGVILCAGLVAGATNDTLVSGSADERMTLGLAAYGAIRALDWLYYIVSEVFWGGKTIGKHVLKLRVVDGAGGPASKGALLLRNVLRVFDALPFLSLLGGIVMFLDARSRRFGDLAAGTIVVRERREDDGTAERYTANLAKSLPAADAAVIAAFLDRRGELSPSARADLGARCLARARAANPDVADGPPETILAQLAHGRTALELRAAIGPARPAETGPSPPELPPERSAGP